MRAIEIRKNIEALLEKDKLKKSEVNEVLDNYKMVKDEGLKEVLITIIKDQAPYTEIHREIIRNGIFSGCGCRLDSWIL